MKMARVKLVFAMLIFGSIGLFVRNIDLSSGQIALARGVIGSLFLLLVGRITKQKLSQGAIRRNLLLLLLSGALIGFNWILLFEAYKYTTISKATLSYYFAPVFVMVLSPWILKERLEIKKILGMILALGGMFLVTGIGEGAGKADLLGIGFGLMAAMLYATVVLMNKFLKGLTGLETTLVQISAASIVLLPYILITEDLQYKQLNSIGMILLVIVGIINTGLAYLLYFSSMKDLSGQTISVFSYIDPISAILLSVVLLGEHMSAIQVIGGILILGGTFLSERKSMSPQTSRN
ncbi:MAG: EamA family transporter [Clostridiales bacterium]|nr:EamA family transporter [Clostridiales bacterium]